MMLCIRFEFRDEMTRGQWQVREFTGFTVEECIELYGLGKDCDYRIISIEEI